MLLRESGIAPDVAEERGYFTADTRAEVPEIFKDYQRRPGLVIPTLSPGGERGYRLRAYRPRPRKDGKAPKYDQPTGAKNRLDVLPRNLARLRDASEELWLVEGEKKSDSLASRGLCVVAVTGAWNYLSGGEPVECFDHIALEGRSVYICYDSDILTNPGIQGAVERLAGILEDRGAAVRVVYLPDAPDGSKVGADDYLVAGGTVAEMRKHSRPYDPAGVRDLRLERNDKLRGGLEDLRRRWWAHEWKGKSGHSARDTLKVLIDAAEEWGGVVHDGLRVAVSSRTLALKAGISRTSLLKALDALEGAGWLRRDNEEGRAKDKAAAYVLPACHNANYAQLHHYRGNGSEEGGRDKEHISRDSNPGGLAVRSEIPRLRWSAPTFKQRRGVVKGTRRVRAAVPSQRRPAVKRLGKIAGAALDMLVYLGGETTVKELAATLGREKRPGEFRRRQLASLEVARIVEIDGDRVALTPEWGAALVDDRVLTGEMDAANMQAARYKRAREAFHRRGETPPDPAPSLEEMRKQREATPLRRRDGIEKAIARLFAEHPEYRGRRTGQIVCQLPKYLNGGFARGQIGAPKDAELEEILAGEVAERPTVPEPEPAPAPKRRLSAEEAELVKILMAQGMNPGEARAKVLAESAERGTGE